MRKTVYKMIRIVYNIPTAMKSGLKVYHVALDVLVHFGYTPYRDEKRTESLKEFLVSFLE